MINNQNNKSSDNQKTLLKLEIYNSNRELLACRFIKNRIFNSLII